MFNPDSHFEKKLNEYLDSMDMTELETVDFEKKEITDFYQKIIDGLIRERDSLGECTLKDVLDYGIFLLDEEMDKKVGEV